jgi:hypothetical protein
MRRDCPFYRGVLSVPFKQSAATPLAVAALLIAGGHPRRKPSP